MGIGTCYSCRYGLDERPPNHCDNDAHVWHPWPNDPDYVPPVPTPEDLQRELDDPAVGLYVCEERDGSFYLWKKTKLIRRSDVHSRTDS